jgi:hypothetical protein
VLPRSANTHTESSGTGLQTTRLREDARRLIHQAVGGTDRHLVIFCGSGATAAVNKLVGILELRLPAGLDARYRLGEQIPPGQPTATSTWPSWRPSWSGSPGGRCGSAASRPPPTSPAS